MNVLQKIRPRLELYDLMSGGIVSFNVFPIESVEDLNRWIVDIEASSSVTLYGVRKLAFNLLTMLFVLLTFGVAYPPLAVIILLCVTFQTISVQLCMHYHHLQVRHSEEWLALWQQIVQHDIEEVTAVLFNYNSYYLACLLCALFVSCFLIDMTVATDWLLTVLLPCVLVGLVLILLIHRYCMLIYDDRGNGSGNGHIGNDGIALMDTKTNIDSNDNSISNDVSCVSDDATSIVTMNPILK